MINEKSSKALEALGDFLSQFINEDNEKLGEEWGQALKSIPAKKLQKLKQENKKKERGTKERDVS